MKMADAMAIIDGKPQGYMVAFDRVEGNIVGGDYFPDKHGGEPLIPTEHEAWELARRFAITAPPNVRDVYVVDHQFQPVAGYVPRTYRPSASILRRRSSPIGKEPQ